MIVGTIIGLWVMIGLTLLYTAYQSQKMDKLKKQLNNLKNHNQQENRDGNPKD
ncbi:unnamed protein product [marine sediment metagenome]|uniref:CcmD family protein n=1 Tax=marine sediment metagenome TaxID=412755 RepID=X0W0P5_9ZZZZ